MEQINDGLKPPHSESPKMTIMMGPTVMEKISANKLLETINDDLKNIFAIINGRIGRAEHLKDIFLPASFLLGTKNRKDKLTSAVDEIHKIIQQIADEEGKGGATQYSKMTVSINGQPSQQIEGEIDGSLLELLENLKNLKEYLHAEEIENESILNIDNNKQNQLTTEGTLKTEIDKLNTDIEKSAKIDDQYFKEILRKMERDLANANAFINTNGCVNLEEETKEYKENKKFSRTYQEILAKIKIIIQHLASVQKIILLQSSTPLFQIALPETFKLRPKDAMNKEDKPTKLTEAMRVDLWLEAITKLNEILTSVGMVLELNEPKKNDGEQIPISF